MKKFFVNSIIFVFPFLILLGLPFLVFVKAGEFIPVDRVVSLQHDLKKTVLFGQAYTDSRRDQEYKIKATLARRPEVLMIGTSRVLGYRSIFFKDQDVFYNAGRSINYMSDLNYFLERIPSNQTPRLFILSLDQNFFFDERQPDPEYNSYENVMALFLKHNWRLVYKDYFQHKFKIGDLFQLSDTMDAIGLNATVNQKGFRNDGSYYYGDMVNNSQAEAEAAGRKQEVVSLITPQSFCTNYYGTIILPEVIFELRKFLETSQKRGVTVIGFISPYSPGIYGKIQSFNDACSRAAGNLDQNVGALFAQYNARFVDASDVTRFGGSDTEFFDAGHYSEKLSLRLLIALAEASPELKYYLDVPFLREQLKASQNNFTVFPQP